MADKYRIEVFEYIGRNSGWRKTSMVNLSLALALEHYRFIKNKEDFRIVNQRTKEVIQIS